ncbi:MAG: hypothetical protein J6T62_11595 [Fibrobacter sp.]|nr:hypothetical protein [Fibrobacter sp.]
MRTFATRNSEPDCSTKSQNAMLTLASNLFNLVFSSDPFGIGVITLLLIALFFVAWKAPAWVKETGLAALATGWLWTVCEFMAMAKAIVECEPDVDMYIVWAAVPSALIPAAYGLVVYIISLIIRIVRKPKM